EQDANCQPAPRAPRQGSVGQGGVGPARGLRSVVRDTGRHPGEDRRMDQRSRSSGALGGRSGIPRVPADTLAVEGGQAPDRVGRSAPRALRSVTMLMRFTMPTVDGLRRFINEVAYTGRYVYVRRHWRRVRAGGVPVPPIRS